MPSFMITKLLPTAKATGTYVDAIALLTNRIRAFYSNGVSEITGTGVAFDLEAWFTDGYYVIKAKLRENPGTGGRDGGQGREISHHVL